MSKPHSHGWKLEGEECGIYFSFDALINNLVLRLKNLNHRD
jgi:hypothetical protein